MVMASIAMTATSMSSSRGAEEATSLSEPNPMQAWWETIAKARATIRSLDALIGPLPSLHALQDAERPAKSLLDSPHVAALISARLSTPLSGSASDALCQWLYDTHQTLDPDLQLVVLRYVPLVAGLYLSRIVAHKFSEPPAGFEAVILALYTSEVKARGGRPVVVNIADLGQPSLYHAPRNPSEPSGSHTLGQLCAPLEPHVAIKSTKRAAVVGVALDLFHRKIALMPAAAKVEFCEFVQAWAGQNCSCSGKLDDVAGLDTTLSLSASASASNVDEIQSVSPKIQSGFPEIQSGNPKFQSESPRIHSGNPKFQSESPRIHSGNSKFQSESPRIQSGNPKIQSGNPKIQFGSPEESIRALVDDAARLGIQGDGFADKSLISLASSSSSSSACGEFGSKGARVPLPWELLQPILRILGHCLLGPLNPQEVMDVASVATRMLFARVSHDLIPEAILATRSLIRLDIAARVSNEIARSAASTPTKSKKPEVLLVSK